MTEIRKVEIVEVIKITSTRGNGETEVFREIVSYWSPQGILLAEVDPEYS